MSLGLVSADFRNTELKALETVYFNAESVLQFLKGFPSDTPVQEIVILSTCNRVECYFISEDPLVASDWILKQWASFKKLDMGVVESILKVRVNEIVVHEHLFRVVSGLESMVLGETEILGQTKQAYDLSQREGWTKGYLNKLFQTAIATGKRVRTETEISQGSYSVTSIAIEAMRERFVDFYRKSIVILGAGTMGVRAIRKLSSLEHPDVTLVNRTVETAKPLVEGFGLKTLSYELFFRTVSNYDIVLLATGADAYLINKAHFENMVKPTLVIDLGIPRNANPNLIEVQGLELLSVYGLRDIADKTLLERRTSLIETSHILEDELDKFHQWQGYRQKQCQIQSV